MKTFKDTATGQFWQFDDDVVIVDNQFFAPHDLENPLVVPSTLIPSVLPPPVPYVPPIPQSVSRRQGRLALLDPNVNKLDAVESAIDAIADLTEKRAAQIEYEADTWERGNAFLQSMWAQLGGTEAELDNLFVLASTK